MSVTTLIITIICALLFVVIYSNKEKIRKGATSFVIRTKSTLALVTIGAILVIVGVSTLVNPGTTLDTFDLVDSKSARSPTLQEWAEYYNAGKCSSGLCEWEEYMIDPGITRGIGAGVFLVGGGLLFWSWKRVRRGI